MAYNFNNTWAKNPWAENIWAKPEMMDKVLGNGNEEEKDSPVANITKGIFIYGLSNEDQIKIFTKKIGILVPNLKLLCKYSQLHLEDKDKGIRSEGKGVIYVESGNVDPLSPIQMAVKSGLDDKIFLKHSSSVEHYDKFNGMDFQLINIEHFNNTTQYEFLAYAITHLIREFRWAVSLKITDGSEESYKKAHNRTLLHDLEVWDELAKRKKSEWNWLESLKKGAFLSGFESLIDFPGIISRVYRDENELKQEGYDLVSFSSKLEAPDKFNSISFINVKKWDEYIKWIFDPKNNNKPQPIFSEFVTHEEVLFD